MAKKITCISINEDLYRKAREEAIRKGIRISTIYDEMLKLRYNEDE